MPNCYTATCIQRKQYNLIQFPSVHKPGESQDAFWILFINTKGWGINNTVDKLSTLTSNVYGCMYNKIQTHLNTFHFTLTR